MKSFQNEFKRNWAGINTKITGKPGCRKIKQKLSDDESSIKIENVIITKELENHFDLLLELIKFLHDKKGTEINLTFTNSKSNSKPISFRPITEKEVLINSIKMIQFIPLY